MIKTFAPVWARLIAVFVAVVVFPSEGRLDVINRDFGARPAVESKIDVRRWRYASASGERGSAEINKGVCGDSSSESSEPTSSSLRLGIDPIVGIAAKAGR